MTSKGKASENIAKLRWRAEEFARGKVAPSPEDLESLPPQDLRQMFHELSVHQIELEMQNEELRRTQAQLDAARARYFDLYDLAPVGYCIISHEGLILEANLTVITLLDIARAALVRQPITRFIHREDQDIYYRHRKQLFGTGEPQACELRMVKKDGTALWMRMAAIVALDPSASSKNGSKGMPVSRVVMSDITERKGVESALARSEALLRTTQQLTHIGSWEWDVETQSMSWTEEMYHLHDFKPGGSTPGPKNLARSQECYLPADRPMIQAAFQRCLREGKPYDLELSFTTAKGRQIRVRTVAEPVLETGKVVRVVGFIMDITDRRAQMLTEPSGG